MLLSSFTCSLCLLEQESRPVLSGIMYLLDTRMYSELRIHSRNKTTCACGFNMASKYVRILCGAQFYCGSTNENIASRKTDDFLASAMYS